MIDKRNGSSYIVMGGYSLRQTLYAFAAGVIAGFIAAMFIFTRIGCSAWWTR